MIRQGDCLELMKDISDHSVDMILCDLPYGTTRNRWDSVISLPELWRQYERVIKENGCIELIDTVYDSAKSLSVQKDQSKKLQQEVVDNYETYREAIERAYDAAERS